MILGLNPGAAARKGKLMRVLALIAGIFCLVVVLLDAFQTIILPRRATGRFRLTRIFYVLTWRPWVFIASLIRNVRKRETLFSFYGPLSLIFLLVTWAAAMVFGYALIYYSMGSPFNDATQKADLRTDLYVSGTTIFTLGLGDVTPQTRHSRELIILEAGMGFGFLAVVMGYFPVLYGAFSRREVSISLLDARAGSPPTAAELMRRHSYEGAESDLSMLLVEWERWSAELLESHISYPLLCYFRSQHTNQSWIGALTAILDTSALLIAGIRGHEARQAQLTFAMARHALVDLSQVFSLDPKRDTPDRLPPERYEELYEMLCQSGVSVCRDGKSYERLREMRALYEPYSETLSAYLRMPLPPWFTARPHKDNWLAVAKLRASADSANPGSTQEGRVLGAAQSIARVIDEHHDF
jgi:Ion channel